MIQNFVDRFMANKGQLETLFSEKHPGNYQEIVTAVIRIITDKEYGSIDPERIHEINDGNYQGTLVYVIAEVGYQPSRYWYVKVEYGSCSGCDLLENIRGYTGEAVSEEQTKQYMQLALNIVQKLKEMKDTEIA